MYQIEDEGEHCQSHQTETDINLPNYITTVVLKTATKMHVQEIMFWMGDQH